MPKKTGKSVLKRPFGKTAGQTGDRFEPTAGARVVIVEPSERKKFVPSPSKETTEFIRRSDRATSGRLQLVGKSGGR